MGRNSITEGAYLYALNLKTGKKKFMLDGVSAVYVVGKKVLANGAFFKIKKIEFIILW